MKGPLARRPSPAMVVAVIALVMAMVGTGFAALGKNTVGTKQLKKNAVTKAKIKKNSVVTGKIRKNAVNTAKIKNNAVNGAKVNEATLSTVPSAQSAQSAQTAQLANSLGPVEATHLVGTPGQPGFEGGSHNYIAEGVPYGFNPVGFYKDHEGIVHLEGVAETGSTGMVFTLPPGFRPAPSTIIPWNLAYFSEGETEGGESVFGDIETGEALIVGTGVVSGGIDLSGKIVGESEDFVILDGLTFKAGS